MRICVLLLAVGFVCTRGVCQSTSDTTGTIRSNAIKIETSSPAPLTLRSEAAGLEIGAGGTQLSLQQAIDMALKRNLDIQLEEVDQSVADFSLTRTQGGATPRAINFNIAETPTGEAIASVPLLATTSPTLSPYGIEPSTITIPSSYDAAHVLQPYRSLSIATAPFSSGAPVAALDLNLQGQYGWIYRDPSNSLASSSSATAADTAVTNNTLGSTTLLKGFSSGASIQLGINDAVWSLYSGRSSAVPFSHPNGYGLISQPLLRGAGKKNNTRYIAIAKTNKNIAAAILEEQMIAIVAGVEGLYYDLVSLQNSVKVQQQALDAANNLLSDDRQQLAVGHLPPIEVTRAQALVSAIQLELVQANSLREQQEIVLRSVIDPQSLTQTTLNQLEATDELLPPSELPAASIPDLIRHALEQRPDIEQARMQIMNGERAVAGSANARLPELDVYGSFQSRGVVSTNLVPVGGDPLTGAPVYDPLPTGGLRASELFQAGIQFKVPIQNRVADADLGADRAQLQQERLRSTQMEAQAAAEIRNAVIAWDAAKQAVRSAANARDLQEQLLTAEGEKFRAGFSTNFAVIQQQAYLAQAETTEIAAQAAWKKAGVQLDRALGDTLQRHGIDVGNLRRNRVPVSLR
ncbi:MAG TPA: TolC family protein [Candidatus Acidoferrum sp.]|nr:TolC family protein [Candidatus Acidoferrum sp.]